MTCEHKHLYRSGVSLVRVPLFSSNPKKIGALYICPACHARFEVVF